MTMSKSTARVILISLIGIALIAAIYVSVQGAFAKSESIGAQAHVVSGLQTNFNHDRSTAAELDALQAQSDMYLQPGPGRGGCEHESQSVPLD
ncbi:MAG TPA: hypothetical protein VFG81_09350 [Anaerolineales bacterium]|nr:hypothetical protein [Anaerolineales bacterium]